MMTNGLWILDLRFAIEGIGKILDFGLIEVKSETWKVEGGT